MNNFNLEIELDTIKQGNNLMFFISNAMIAWDTEVLDFNKADMETVGQLMYLAWQQNQEAVMQLEKLTGITKSEIKK